MDDKKHHTIKVRVSRTQLEELLLGARRSNPADPRALSAWLRDLALREAARLRARAVRKTQGTPR